MYDSTVNLYTILIQESSTLSTVRIGTIQDCQPQVKYLQNTGTCTSRLFGPSKQHYIIFKKAQDHRKW